MRINPDEIHLSDPENYEKIYSLGSKFCKSPNFYRAFDAASSVFTAVSNKEHKVRRAALNPLFSRRMVLELEHVVQSKVAKLKKRLHEALRAGKPINLYYGFKAISIDVITDYAFDNCYNLLNRDDFGIPFFSMITDLVPSIWFFQQFPFVQPLALRTPMWLAKLLNKSLGSFMQIQAVLDNSILKSVRMLITFAP